jgi:hypothetical protein
VSREMDLNCSIRITGRLFFLGGGADFKEKNKGMLPTTAENVNSICPASSTLEIKLKVVMILFSA